MARALLLCALMRLKAPIALYVLVFLLASPFLSHAQETEPPDGARISAVRVSGFEMTRLSPGLQDTLAKLDGTTLNRAYLKELGARLEAEQPRFVVAVRVTQDADGRARVTFVVARIGDQDRDPDINNKYVVDDVRLHGVPPREVTPELRKELDSLSGKPLDSDAAERVGNQLRAAFPGYDVDRRTGRSDQKGHINVIYLLTRPEWARFMRFEPLSANTLFHSDQGWGAVLPLAVVVNDVRVLPIATFSNADDLIEEYSGFALRVESRRLGTERLGMSFEWSTNDPDWRNPTLAALALRPDIPGPYSGRRSVTPLLKFAFTPAVTVIGGVGITELDPVPDDSGLSSQMANVAIASLRYKQQWPHSAGPDHEAGAAFTVRAGRTSLQSDFTYESYLAEVDYLYRWRKHSVLVSAMAGGISGTAPLFERFTLGDSKTLRGWDKYEISPVGGNRMFSTSLEYRLHDVMLFLDAGSVWDTGSEKRVRFSTGLGYTPGPLFITVGFPLNTDDSRAVFSMGLRFGLSSTGIKKY